MPSSHEILVKAKQVTQFDLFTEAELASLEEFAQQYTATIMEYHAQGTAGITPYVLSELVKRKHQVSQTYVALDFNMVRRYLAVYSFMHTTPMPLTLVLLDDVTKRIYIALRLLR